ncbi:hypothetical protein C4K03_3510 [Pseudomonas synxantha]|uniref:Uncharacterized protein n=1 Tax=Pseudomonas synxantha TaxID=47883 RepID=A0A3G7U8J5_9PSED|nr:hypothetical protein C4K03_3510 [Pseudomonas synxantha]
MGGFFKTGVCALAAYEMCLFEGVYSYLKLGKVTDGSAIKQVFT